MTTIFARLMAQVTIWAILISAMLHLLYIFFPPAYYIQMHGGDEMAARWVSVFAVPILLFFLYYLPTFFGEGADEK